jgi:hypothetical protein
MRSNITDRWVKENGERTARHGIGIRWRARYFDESGKEYTRVFARKADAKGWLGGVASMATGQYTAPEAGLVTVAAVYASWSAAQGTSPRKPPRPGAARGAAGSVRSGARSRSSTSRRAQYAPGWRRWSQTASGWRASRTTSACCVRSWPPLSRTAACPATRAAASNSPSASTPTADT